MNIILKRYDRHILSKYNMYYRYYQASNRKGSILCIHGILSDSRLFDNFADVLAKDGFDVYAIDLPGYGLSEGDKGNADFNNTLESIHDLIASIKDKPFLLGFSLGTVYAAYYASRYKDIKGLILASSLFHPLSNELPDYAKEIYKLYQEKPTERINLLECIQLDNDKYDYIANDPLCKKEYSLSYLADIFAKATDNKIFGDIECPVLILHGKYDTFTNIKQVKETFRLLASKNKKLVVLDTDHWLYDTFFYNGSNNNKVVNIIKEWIDGIKYEQLRIL